MSTPDSRSEAIGRTLAHLAGDAPDAGAVAEAAVETWHKMAVRIAPVIGTRGVDVLFRRSLHLTGAAIPWLASAEGQGNSAALLAGIKSRLAGRETLDAAEASRALLANFTELLISLIGESLTEHLLLMVWVSPQQASEQESES